MADIFDEIDEELKKDRAQLLWARYGKYVIGACAAVILAVGGHQGYGIYSANQIEKAADLYHSSLKADDVISSLNNNVDELTGGYKMLARFQIAAAEARAGDHAAAQASYIALSEDKNIDPLYQQFAQLLSVMNAPADSSAQSLQDRLAPLIGAAGTWQGLALEQSAGLDLQTGKVDAAKAKLEQIIKLTEIPQSLRQRAQRILDILNA